jgi:NADP-dependent 3-hydroxy acid dehydrogenase YdfG
MSTRTAIVTGASRGFGRATAIALVNAGVHVIGVGRDREQLDVVRDEAGAEFTPVAADAADPVTAGRLVDTYRPDILVLNAGAHPLLRPLHKYSWETFSSNWEVDVRHVFNWTREALLAPLDPGERGGYCLQRRRTSGFLDRRQLFRSKGDHPVHDGIRSGGIRP